MSYSPQEFLSFALNKGALKFGEFTLNSGRISPYFLNTGTFYSGSTLSTLSNFYASKIMECTEGDFMLYGPAYKGIALAAATALSLYRNHGVSVNYSFNRKEAKDHGEQGQIVGAPVQGRVVIVEDVITSGLSIDKATEIIRRQNAEPIAVVISLDRMEASKNGSSTAVEEVKNKHGISVESIANVYDLLHFLESRSELNHHVENMQAYLDKQAILRK